MIESSRTQLLPSHNLSTHSVQMAANSKQQNSEIQGDVEKREGGDTWVAERIEATFAPPAAQTLEAVKIRHGASG